MTFRRRSSPGALAAVLVIAGAHGAPTHADAASLQLQTVQAWNAYVASTEARIHSELASPQGFLVTDFSPDRGAVRDAIGKGAIPVGRLLSRDGEGRDFVVPDGLIAHWRGAVLLRGVSLDALLQRLQHPENGPHQQEVVSLRVLNRKPDHLQLAIRITREEVVTVTYDTEHLIDFRRDGKTRASSRSISTKVVEIENAGTAAERALAPGQDRGFLWRMNSYWRYQEIDGGVIVELESLTLSRSIPLGLGGVVAPIINRIARESISRTLDTIRRTHASGMRTASRS
jgi:hypothetical protein